MNFFENLSKEVKITMAAVVCLVAFGGTLWKGHDYMEKYALAGVMAKMEGYYNRS